MNNRHPEPRTDAAALVLHADHLAEMTDAERAEYLDGFSGQQIPPPADNYAANGRGKSLREALGDNATASLLAKADKAKAAKVAIRATPPK